MDRFVRKLVLLMVILGIGVFYGVSMTKKGVEEIYGPIGADAAEQQNSDSDAHVASVEAGRPTSVTEASKAAEHRAALATQAEPQESGTLVMRLLGKLGSLLQLLADGLIQLLVRLGEAVLS